MLKITGILLLTISTLLSFLWYYWLAPLRHAHDAVWMFDHSARRQWIEAQKQIRRTGIDHDSSIAIGCFGDKKWTEWAIRQIETRSSVEESDNCGTWPYHLPSALSEMTNQRLVGYSDWRAWWTTNCNKTQLEWIRDGFARRGIHLERPLTTNNIVALLTLIASTNSTIAINQTNRIDGSLRYNAMRWLRDSGFMPRHPNVYSIPAEDREMVTGGLVKYALWLGEHRSDPGKLPIWEAHSEDSVLGIRIPWIERTPFKWLPPLVLVGMIMTGVMLFWKASRKDGGLTNGPH